MAAIRGLGMVKAAVSWVVAMLLAASLGAVASHDLANAFERESSGAREAFFSGDFESSQRQYARLAEGRTANRPLYCCELLSSALLSGDRETAFRATQEAIGLLEDFWDPAREEEAVSLWGREAEKVYKGDPYERAMLYLLYGTQLLERGDVDNAAAAFRRSLLMDGDTEDAAYQADFGLPLFFLAKCDMLRDDPEQARLHLRQAFRAACADGKFSDELRRAIEAEYASGGPEGGLNERLRTFCSFAGRDELRALSLKEGVIDWVIDQAIPLEALMAFDRVVLYWNGVGPTMVRMGEYGETRCILSGSPDTVSVGFRADDRDIPAAVLPGELGNVNTQATTRGGRPMDNVLKDKAALKSSLATTGQVLQTAGVAAAAVGGTSALINRSATDANIIVLAVSAAFLLLGAIIEGIASAIHAEADTRNWRCLPYSLEIVCFVEADATAPRMVTQGSDGSAVTECRLVFPGDSSGTPAPVRFGHLLWTPNAWPNVVHERSNLYARRLLLTPSAETLAAYEALADGGDADAAFWLAVRAANLDPQEALRRFAQAEAAGHPEARFSIARMLLDRRSSAFDEAAGLEAMRSLAEEGNPMAQYVWGCILAAVPGAAYDSIPADPDAGKTWLRKSAAGGCELAVWCLRGLIDGSVPGPADQGETK